MAISRTICPGLRLFCLALLLLTGILAFTSTASAATYTVQPGDTLYLIGLRYGISAWDLQQANNLSSTWIYPGQTLWVPDRGGNTYVVQRGDTLYLIGQRYGLSYQQIMAANNLTSDVIYPGQILRIPAGSYQPVASREASYSAGDLDLLARLVYGEARGEPYAGQVAVAAVAINRAKDARFPSTIAGVIYDPDAFTCVNDGQFYLTPDATAYQAAREALRGYDPTGGALYFWNPALVPANSWVWTRTIITQIGNHVFAR
ncbi:LysM peptidoglycan-binding domain-containing protein [Moorella sulfitireducens]|uniref:LysM peptidoglycan-binding domain-containing protein n=1 Tax=Neomoorella sulfitireducens TaxID=2972948 RepID=UPI0021AC3C9A|nr:LysM peptidoglycan-binding domain-containing protein [Moorella sulfitireducens]